MTIEEFERLPIEKKLEIIDDFGQEKYSDGCEDTNAFEWGSRSDAYNRSFENFLKSVIY